MSILYAYIFIVYFAFDNVIIKNSTTTTTTTTTATTTTLCRRGGGGGGVGLYSGALVYYGMFMFVSMPFFSGNKCYRSFIIYNNRIPQSVTLPSPSNRYKTILVVHDSHLCTIPL